MQILEFCGTLIFVQANLNSFLQKKKLCADSQTFENLMHFWDFFANSTFCAVV